MVTNNIVLRAIIAAIVWMLEIPWKITQWCKNMLLTGFTGMNELERMLAYESTYIQWEVFFIHVTIPASEFTISTKCVQNTDNYLMSKIKTQDIILSFTKDKYNYSYISDKIKNIEKVSNYYEKKLFSAVCKISEKNNNIGKILHNANINCNLSKIENRNILENIWVTLFDDITVPSSLSKCSCKNVSNGDLSDWSYIGFQNPLTDFRHHGKLSLLNFHFVVINFTKNSLRAFNESNNCKAWLPFALTAITVTKWLVDLVYSGVFDVYLYNPTMDCLTVSHYLFSYIYFDFINNWVNNPPKDTLQFNQFSIEYLKKIRLYFKNINAVEGHMRNKLYDTSDNLISELRNNTQNTLFQST